MIPLLAVIGVRGRWNFRLWLPLFLVWLLLLPFALLLPPCLIVAAPFVRADAWRATGAMFSALRATRGTEVEVAARGHSLLLHIY
jgi:hypothetical protein